jgi:lipopolysaccharide export system protein LptA
MVPTKVRLAVMAALAWPAVASAQAIDLSHGGPVTVTALGGIDWDQQAQTVTAHDDARAVRGAVTVTADRLIAHYRKKACAAGTTPPGAKPGTTSPSTTASGTPAPCPPGTAPASTVATSTAQPAPAAANAAPDAAPAGGPDETGNNEIYRLEADGHVHIFTATDQAWGDHGVYDMDQAVLVLTGQHLKMTTPTDLLTARDVMEYWSQKHMSVGRGDASVTSNDARRITADTLVGYTVDNSAPPVPGAPPPPPVKKEDDPNKQQDPLLSSGKLQKVTAFGHVQVRTPTEIVNGDRGVYVPDTGLARIVGHVHVTRGDNQLNGAAAIVNMKTGVATIVQTPGVRVQGLIVPNEQQPKGTDATKPGATKPDATKAGDKTGAKPASDDDHPGNQPPAKTTASQAQPTETPESTDK